MIINLEFSKFYSRLKDRFLTKEEFKNMFDEEIKMCLEEGKILEDLDSFFDWANRMLA